MTWQYGRHWRYGTVVRTKSLTLTGGRILGTSAVECALCGWWTDTAPADGLIGTLVAHRSDDCRPVPVLAAGRYLVLKPVAFSGQIAPEGFVFQRDELRPERVTELVGDGSLRPWPESIGAPTPIRPCRHCKEQLTLPHECRAARSPDSKGAASGGMARRQEARGKIPAAAWLGGSNVGHHRANADLGALSTDPAWGFVEEGISSAAGPAGRRDLIERIARDRAERRGA